MTPTICIHTSQVRVSTTHYTLDGSLVVRWPDTSDSSDPNTDHTPYIQVNMTTSTTCSIIIHKLDVMAYSARRQAAESIQEVITARIQQSGFIFSQKTIFQPTQNGHSHAYVTGWCGLQGRHALVTMKLALWTTKWSTFVFSQPLQVNFSQQ